MSSPSKFRMKIEIQYFIYKSFCKVKIWKIIYKLKKEFWIFLRLLAFQGTYLLTRCITKWRLNEVFGTIVPLALCQYLSFNKYHLNELMYIWLGAPLRSIPLRFSLFIPLFRPSVYSWILSLPLCRPIYLSHSLCSSLSHFPCLFFLLLCF